MDAKDVHSIEIEEPIYGQPQIVLRDKNDHPLKVFTPKPEKAEELLSQLVKNWLKEIS